jgi:hypothetical protein
MIQMQSMVQRCKHKWKCNMHMYINPPNQISKGKKTPSSLHKHTNVAWSKGLVRISASCFSVGTWMRSMFPFSTLSLKKWYLTSICLVLEWNTGFLATLMALVLSHMGGTPSLLVYKVYYGVQLFLICRSRSIGTLSHLLPSFSVEMKLTPSEWTDKSKGCMREACAATWPREGEK